MRALLLASLAAACSGLIRPPVVILPGFGNADVDYVTPLGQPEEKGLRAALRRRGFDDVSIVPLPRWEWIRVAGGLADPAFWSCSQRPDGLAYGWYVARARETIDAACARSGRALVLGHSAGGWLARATLGDGGAWPARDRVRGLVTLGAPHFPPPEGSPPCATRGALAYLDANLPGAFLDGVAYVTVAGSAIAGSREPPGDYDPLLPSRELLAGPTEADELYARRGEGSAARVAYTNYVALGGDGAATGDGVIPVACAHLEGATQLTLDDVLHSINEAGTALPTERWYGSEAVIDRWLDAALAKLQ